ncbi:MAG: hypothetical protein BA874_13390 [Desulfuromonadales bacterium C00003068]|nr:MAG: hypothetical protein BA874_13390 [Desulfuromonadales bacterium C00003068]
MTQVNAKRQSLPIVIAITFSMVLFLYSLGHCECYEGDGATAQVSRTLNVFDRIKVDGAYTVTVKRGELVQCLLRGDRNLLYRVMTQVENGQLVIRNDGSLRMRQPLEIELQLPNLLEFTAIGAHEVTITGIAEDAFSLILNGANLAKVSGHVGVLRLQLDGSSILQGENLRASTIDLVATGTTSVQVSVENSLTVKATGLSDVIYSGEPSSVTVELSGLAELNTAK